MPCGSPGSDVFLITHRGEISTFRHLTGPVRELVSAQKGRGQTVGVAYIQCFCLLVALR